MKTLRAIIVEDEIGASNHLSRMIKQIEAPVNITAILTSVDETVEWLEANPHPDLAFFDIQLGDGLSFEIFAQCRFNFPVIFTTAFNQYAIDAFKVNSIDYLLKPIKEEDLRFSLRKYKELTRVPAHTDTLHRVIEMIESRQRSSTLLIERMGKLIPVPDRDFSYFYVENGLLRGCTRNNETFPLNSTVEDLSLQLNPAIFFRANRQFIVNRHFIVEVELYFNGRLLLKLSPPSKTAVLISKARVPVFKSWLKESS